jgi:hypothetical protein
MNEEKITGGIGTKLSRKMRKRNERRWSRTRKREIIQRMKVSRKRSTPSRSDQIGDVRRRRAEGKQGMEGQDAGVNNLKEKFTYSAKIAMGQTA